MRENDVNRQHLLQALGALRPYLPHIVIVGGWVPTLYREFGGVPWEGRLSFTDEVDVLSVPPIPVEDGASIEDALRSAGYEPLASDRPSAHWHNHETGSEIEFLTIGGHALSLGISTPLPDHGGVAAISLADMEILHEFRAVLRIPIARRNEPDDFMDVTVPTLGAYVVNKACTYPKRGALDTGLNPKQAKDLVYLRDVAHGGSAVMKLVEDDLRSIAATDKPNAFRMEKARSNLALTCRDTLARDSVESAVAMLVERDRIDQEAARADLLGHLLDLEGVIADALGENQPA